MPLFRIVPAFLCLIIAQLAFAGPDAVIANSALYRKLALNGSQSYENEPLEQEQYDSEPESTYVDALTLGLINQVTDVYVPFIGDALPLEVRRNWRTEFIAGEDLPAEGVPVGFGMGWGWSTGIGSYLQIDYDAENGATLAICDEQGIEHRFIQSVAGTYIPVQGSLHHQDSRRMTLEPSNDGKLKFTRSHGTQLIFEPLPDPSAEGGPQATIYRTLQASHPGGVRFDYRYHHQNFTAIPDEIGFGRCKIHIETNEHGLVSRVVDPRGNDFLYTYKEFPIGESKRVWCLSEVFKPASDGTHVATAYDYEVVELAQKPGVWQVCLVEIRDALGNAHTFSYQDDTREHLGGGRVIERIQMPGNKNAAQFASTWLGEGEEHRIATTVKNTIGSALLYEFHDWSAKSLGSVAVSPTADLDYYERMTIKRYDGAHLLLFPETGQVKMLGNNQLLAEETFRFNPFANFQLSETIDSYGNRTQYLYSDPLPAVVQSSGDRSQPTEYYAKFNELIDALGNSTYFQFGGPFHEEVRRMDAEGRITTYQRDPKTGEITRYEVFASASALREESPIYRKEYSHSDPRFPGFVTQSIIRKLEQEQPSPEWECDIVNHYEANEFGWVSKRIGNPGGLNEITAYQYNLSGSKVTQAYRNGYTELFDYDGYNRLREIYYPSKQASTFREVDNRGNLIEVRDVDGSIQQMEYNPLTKKTKETTIRPNVTNTRVWEYNEFNSKTLESEYGDTTTFTYGPLGRLVSQVKGDDVTVYKYNGANSSIWLFMETDLRPSWVETTDYYPYTLEYDALQRTVSVNDIIDGTSKVGTTYTYDRVGNKLMETDQDGTTAYTYDALNRLVSERKPDGTEIRHLYSSTGLHYGTSRPDGSFDLKVFDAVGDDVTPKPE